ncbi:MAG: hypothetical protein ACK53K_08735 [Burkholderiales bacterium]
MNAISVLLGLLRHIAIVCGSLIAFVTLLIVGGSLWSMQLDHLQDTLISDRQQLLGQIEAAEAKIQFMTQSQIVLDRSVRAGLVGPARREEWVQSLIAAHERLGLKGTPSFKLSKPQRLTEAITAAMGAVMASNMQSPSMFEPSTPAVPGTGLEVYSHLLEFKLQDVHEGEVLSILSSLLSEYPDIQKPGGCHLMDPQPTGLTAECSIRFFNVVPPRSGLTTPLEPTVPMNSKS